MAELSSSTGVPVATIKYYLREGLLPRGEVTASPNQAQYGREHVRRLQLVRSLVEVGGLSIAAVRAVLANIDDPTLPLHHALGQTLAATEPEDADAADDAAHRAAAEHLAGIAARKGWEVRCESAAWRAAVEVLVTLDRIGGERLTLATEAYADAVERVARADLDTVAAIADRETRVEMAVVGTVLGDRLIAALRRMAQESESARRFPPAPEGFAGGENPRSEVHSG